MAKFFKRSLTTLATLLAILLSGVFPVNWFAPPTLSSALSGSFNDGKLNHHAYGCDSLNWQRNGLLSWKFSTECLMGDFSGTIKPLLSLSGVSVKLDDTTVEVTPKTLPAVPLAAQFMAEINDFSTTIGWDKQPKMLNGEVVVKELQIKQKDQLKPVGNYLVQLGSDYPALQAKISNTNTENPFGIDATAEIYTENLPYPVTVEGFIQRNDPSLLFSWLVPISGKDTEQGSPVFYQAQISY